MTTGKVLTFYSYKGGVGRSMAMANVAVLLASRGKKVLVIDWDLEAPGIEKYFAPYLRGARESTPGIVDMIDAWSRGTELPWKECLVTVSVVGKEMRLLTAGRADDAYPARLAGLQWSRLFGENDLGRYLERLRDEWTEEYDYVLIDSRTGITDTGGICTIHLPDAVIVFFTANEQSLTGAVKAMRAARAAHERLPVDRARLVVVPVPSRDEMTSEHDKAREWRARFAESAAEFYTDWLDKDVPPAEAVKVLRIPYKAYWSFGEPLPVIDDGITEPGSIGYHMALLASLIEAGFDWSEMSAGRFSIPRPHPGDADKPPDKPIPVGPENRLVDRIKKVAPYAVAGAALIALGGIVFDYASDRGGCGSGPTARVDAGSGGHEPTPEERKRDKLLEAARGTQSPLERTLILREIPPAVFPVEEAQLLLDGARVPMAVFTGYNTDAQFDETGDRIVLARASDATVVAADGRRAPATLTTQAPPRLAFFAKDRVVTASHEEVAMWDWQSTPPRAIASIDYFRDHHASFAGGALDDTGMFALLFTDASGDAGTAGDRGTRDAIFKVNTKEGTTQRWWDSSRALLAVGYLQNDVLLVDGYGVVSALSRPDRIKKLFQPDELAAALDSSSQTAPSIKFDRRQIADLQAVVAGDEGWVVIAHMRLGRVVAWRPGTPSQAPIDLAVDADPPLAALAANANRFAAANRDQVMVWDSKAYQWRYEPTTGSPTAIDISPQPVGRGRDEDIIAGTSEGTVEMWRVGGPPIPVVLLPRTDAPAAGVTRVALSLDGKKALALLRDGTVLVWNLSAGPVIEGLTTREEIFERLRAATSACLSVQQRSTLLGEDAKTAAAERQKCLDAAVAPSAGQ